jgi:hypothetical protein
MLRGALTRNDDVDGESELKDDEITDPPNRCLGIVRSSSRVKGGQVLLAGVGQSNRNVRGLSTRSNGAGFVPVGSS